MSNNLFQITSDAVTAGYQAYDEYVTCGGGSSTRAVELAIEAFVAAQNSQPSSNKILEALSNVGSMSAEGDNSVTLRFSDVKAADTFVFSLAATVLFGDDPAKAQNPKPSAHVVGSPWRPIAEADKDIAYVHAAGDIRIGNSYPIWARDEDGRIFECLWADDGKRAYWWDIEGESPVDPVEFMPHPLADPLNQLFAQEADRG